MNKMESALYDLSQMDQLATGDSPVHRLHAAAKLFSTVFYIILVMSFDKYGLTGLFPMLLWPVLLFTLSGIPIRTCFYKLRIVLPLVMAVGLFNPFFDRKTMFFLGPMPISGGIISMLTLMLKGILCLMASFILVASTPFDSICASLRKLHVPGMLVTLLLLTYRYVGLLTEELSIMNQAYQLRAPGQKGIHISAWGSFLGQLLLRSMDRAKELYESMQLRGYHHHFHYAPSKVFGIKDAIWLLLSSLLFLLIRFVPLVRILGSFWVN